MKVYGSIKQAQQDIKNMAGTADALDFQREVVTKVLGGLYGTTEAALITGWDQRKIATYVKRDDMAGTPGRQFPAPLIRVGNRPAWTGEQLRAVEWEPGALGLPGEPFPVKETIIDEFTKRVYMSDRTITDVVSSQPLYFKDEAGNWKEINNGLGAADNGEEVNRSGNKTDKNQTINRSKR